MVLSLQLLAEGIETQEEYDYLIQKNVDLFQRYLLGRPEEVPNRCVFSMYYKPHNHYRLWGFKNS